MKLKFQLILIGALFVLNDLSAQQKSQSIILSEENYKAHFDKYGLTGSIIISDLKNENNYVYDQKMAETRQSPASTFKIFNSLVALETGVVPDTSFTLPWDSVKRGNYPPWHRANSLKSAFKYSVVWYYQELARRIGATDMHRYISMNKYGNENIGDKIDDFWLADFGGKLRISPVEQVAFLKKLYRDELKFSQRSQHLVKGIMLQEESGTRKLYAKTGMTTYPAGKTIGWYVGWVESRDNVYFFATILETDDAGKILAGARKGITIPILEQLGLAEKGEFKL